MIPLAVAAIVAQAPTAPMRRLVYTFTWGTNNTTETHTSGIGDSSGASGQSSNGAVASGTARSGGSNDDRGTITVDVMREQPDKGLIVVVSEEARDTRSASPATCVVYGDTRVICDPNKKINDEELTLLRYLASNFVDPNNIDAKQHWKTASDEGDYATKSDFTISKNANGVMTIDETRTVKSGNAQTIDINSTIGYDFNRQVPTSVNEYSIQRSESGEQYTTFKTQTVLTLQSDTMAAAGAKTT